MKPGILALASISSILVSCNPYGRPPLFDKIAGKIQGASGQDSYLSGVGATSGVNTDLPPEARLGQGYWDLPSGIQGEKHIIIDLKQQKVFYYVGATLVGVSPMSSGKEGFGTPKGTYKIIQKDANYKSGTYGVLRSKSTGAVVNGDYNARARPQEPTSTPPPCPTGCGLRAATACTWALSPDTRSATVACVSRQTWPRRSLNTHLSEPRSPSASPSRRLPARREKKGLLPASLKRGFPLLPDGCPRYADAMAQLPHSGIDKRLRTSLNK
mgnify:CR=1 FL=1